MQLDFEEIKKLIPQRFPFIMIDRVIEIEPGKEATAIKNISGNDIFLFGHFPEKAIMPGALIIEAMAQTAIVLFAAEKRADSSHSDTKDNANNPPESPLSKENPPIPPFSKGGQGGIKEEGPGGFPEEKKGDNKKPIYFLGSVKARFFHPVVPGDQLKIKVVNVKSLPSGAYVSAEAFVDDKKAAEADLVFSAKNE